MDPEKATPEGLVMKNMISEPLMAGSTTRGVSHRMLVVRLNVRERRLKFLILQLSMQAKMREE
jgi:hypothetical protein